MSVEIKHSELLDAIEKNKNYKIIFEDSQLLNSSFNSMDFESKFDYVFSDLNKYNNVDQYENNKFFKRLSKIKLKVSINILITSIGIETKVNEVEKKILKNNYKNILILIEDWTFLSNDTQSFLISLIKQKDKYADKYKKDSITFICGCTNENTKLSDSLFNNIFTIPKLSVDDAFDLIRNNYKEFRDIKKSTFAEIYYLNSGKFEDIVFILQITKINDYKVSKDTLNRALENMLDMIDESVNFTNISQRKVIRLFSVFPKYFDPYEITNIEINLDKYELEKNLAILEKLFILFKRDVSQSEYKLLEQLKTKLLTANDSVRKEVFSLYYQYLTEFYPLDYRRRIDILSSYLKDEDELLYQYVSLFDYFYINNMSDQIEEIKIEVQTSQIEESKKKIFQDICNFEYSEKQISMYNIFGADYTSLNALLLKRDIEFNSVISANSEELKTFCNLLYSIVQKEDFLKYDPLRKSVYYILLIPQFIDKFNNFNKANSLMKKFEVLEPRFLETKKQIDFYKNILYRKSFLFENTTISINKSLKALKFFQTLGDDKEEYMTLNTLLSLSIVNGDLEKATNYKNEIIKLKNKTNLPQYYKSEINFILLEIFENPDLNYKNIRDKYLSILENKDISLTAKNIIYTNLSAISLEYGKIENYEQYKEIINDINNIDDISNIKDESIDDFYRYYFAWFEFGKNIIAGDLENAKNIYMQLNDFIPTIFKGDEDLLKSKYMCYKDIFEEKNLTGKDFSRFIVNKKNNYKDWSFFSRGFMLTDIHHTSIL